MEALTLGKLAPWLERFSSFNDAVVRGWSVVGSGPDKAVFVDIESKDTHSNSGWSMVNLKLGNCTTAIWSFDDRLYFDVLSNGLHVLFDDCCCGLEFGDFVDAPSSIGELRKSRCCAVGANLEWAAVSIN